MVLEGLGGGSCGGKVNTMVMMVVAVVCHQDKNEFSALCLTFIPLHHLPKFG